MSRRCSDKLNRSKHAVTKLYYITFRIDHTNIIKVVCLSLLHAATSKPIAWFSNGDRFYTLDDHRKRFLCPEKIHDSGILGNPKFTSYVDFQYNLWAYPVQIYNNSRQDIANTKARLIASLKLTLFLSNYPLGGPIVTNKLTQCQINVIHFFFAQTKKMGGLTNK